MKKYVFDAGALLVLLQKGPGAIKVNELLKEAIRGRAEVFMSAVNYGEVYGLMLRQQEPGRARAIMHALRPLSIEFADATPQRAFRAAEVKARYKLYYADAFAAALALEYKATLVTSDSDFRRLGHGFPVLWLRA